MEVKEMNEKYDCPKHLWSKQLHEPTELIPLGFTSCPLCILESQASGSEEAANRFTDSVQRHQEKLTPEERKAYDRGAAQRFLKSLQNYNK